MCAAKCLNSIQRKVCMCQNSLCGRHLVHIQINCVINFVRKYIWKSIQHKSPQNYHLLGNLLPIFHILNFFSQFEITNRGTAKNSAAIFPVKQFCLIELGFRDTLSTRLSKTEDKCKHFFSLRLNLLSDSLFGKKQSLFFLSLFLPRQHLR